MSGSVAALGGITNYITTGMAGKFDLSGILHDKDSYEKIQFYYWGSLQGLQF